MNDYSPGLISLLIFVLIVLVQSALVGAAKASAGLTPGCSPDPDYDDRVYRLNRSHQNGVEIMPAAAVAFFAAVLTGVTAFWVNGLMAVFLLTRLVYVLVYARSLGTPTQGLRTFTFVAGWAMLVILCGLSLAAAF
jgi:uncharacterized MAPEG superfamily protein